MADIHVLAGDGVGSWTLLCHYAVPDTSNSVGVSYRTALVVSGIGGASVMVEGTEPWEISPAENAQVAAGAVYEHSIAFLAESGATDNAEMLAAAREAYARDEPRLWNRLQKRLRYYGYTGSKS